MLPEIEGIKVLLLAGWGLVSLLGYHAVEVKRKQIPIAASS